MRFIFVFYLSKTEKTLIREPILSLGPFPESGLERDSGLVWSKKKFKKFSEFALPQFWQVRLMSPFPSRVFISDQIQELSGSSSRQYCRTWYRRFSLYIFMWKMANIITLILLDAEDLNRRIWKTMEPAKILIFRSKIDEKFEFHSWLNLVENWTRMQLTTFHNTNSINQI